MQRLANLERAWIRAHTAGWHDLRDRSRYASEDGNRWASLRFPKISNFNQIFSPDYGVFCHDYLDPSRNGLTKFTDLGEALDFLHLFIHGELA